MAYCRQRDFLFCNLCGTMLAWDTPRHAKCPLCKSKRKMKEIIGKQTSYIVTDEDIRRDLNIESIVDPDDFCGGEAVKQRVDQTCPKCKYGEAEYETRQIRAADEGQTVIFKCLKCGHSWNENT